MRAGDWETIILQLVAVYIIITVTLESNLQEHFLHFLPRILCAIIAFSSSVILKVLGLLFHPQSAPETISEGLKSQFSLWGGMLQNPMAWALQCSVVQHLTTINLVATALRLYTLILYDCILTLQSCSLVIRLNGVRQSTLIVHAWLRKVFTIKEN